MKTILHILLFSFLSLSVCAQHYYVVSVKDSVFADGKLLEKKDKISETARLRFGSARAFAYVVSPGKGYYILSPKKARTRQGNEFLLSLKEALLPPTEFNATSTRDARLVLPLSFSEPSELRRFFQGNLLLIGSTRFEVSSNHFPLDEQHYFALQYYSPDGSQRYPLPGSANTFSIEEGILPFAGQDTAPPRVSLIYFDDSTGEAQRIGDFTLTVLSKPSVLQELQQLHEAVTPIPVEVFLRDHAQPYLDKVYGDIQPGIVRQLVEGAFVEGN